jgi:hypothetical protein
LPVVGLLNGAPHDSLITPLGLVAVNFGKVFDVGVVVAKSVIATHFLPSQYAEYLL